MFGFIRPVKSELRVREADRFQDVYKRQIHALAKPGMRIAVGGYEHNAVMRPLTLRGIEPAVLDAPLWDAAGMERKAREALAAGTELFILNHV